jgi:hypothetical protein
VIGTDCTGCFKSNYHTITTTTVLGPSLAQTQKFGCVKPVNVIPSPLITGPVNVIPNLPLDNWISNDNAYIILQRDSRLLESKYNETKDHVTANFNYKPGVIQDVYNRSVTK